MTAGWPLRRLNVTPPQPCPTTITFKAECPACHHTVWVTQHERELQGIGEGGMYRGWFTYEDHTCDGDA